MAGQSMTVEEVVVEVMKDASYYKFSGGGVTFSGGEATSQPDFLVETCKVLKEQGITTCIETCGFARWDVYEKLLPYMDYFFFDLKTIDEDVHRKLTGVSSKLILDNYTRLVESGANVTVRIPLIPGYNFTEKNIKETIEFLEVTSPACHVSLLPYHSLGASKYDKLDMEYTLDEVRPPSNEDMTALKERFEAHGFEVTIGE